MQNRDVLDRQMTRRLLLGAAGMGGLAFLPAPARAEETVDLRVRVVPVRGRSRLLFRRKDG